MTGKDIQKKVLKTFSAFCFTYDGKNCGIDPFSETRFCLWYGDEDLYVHSIDEVIKTPFFGGKCFNEIADEIDVWDDGEYHEE